MSLNDVTYACMPVLGISYNSVRRTMYDVQYTDL